MAGEDVDWRHAERTQLRRLRLVSLLEGATLIVLICFAVPLKHLAGYPAATAIVGPIHGVAFLIYLWMVIITVSSGDWPRGEIFRLIVVAFIPFGAFMNMRLLQRREDALVVAPAPAGERRS